MKIEVSITKTKFFALIGAFILLAGLVTVYAYNINDQTFGKQPGGAIYFGHSADEIVVQMNTGITPPLQTVQNLLKGGIPAGGGTGTTPGSDVSNYCNSYDSGSAGIPSHNAATISLIKNGENICDDKNGCAYNIIQYDIVGLGSHVWKKFYDTSNIRYAQGDGGRWIGGNPGGNEKTGTNGDSIGQQILKGSDGTNWEGARLYDDKDNIIIFDNGRTLTQAGLTENDVSNQWVFIDDADNKGFIFTVCDF